MTIAVDWEVKQENKQMMPSVQSHYNTPYYNTDLDMTWSCCGSQIFLPIEFHKEFMKMTIK